MRDPLIPRTFLSARQCIEQAEAFRLLADTCEDEAKRDEYLALADEWIGRSEDAEEDSARLNAVLGLFHRSP